MTGPLPAPPPLAPQRATERKPSVPFIMVSLFLATLGIGLVLPVMPSLIASYVGGDLKRASEYYGTFIAVYATMQFIFAPILGGLSDRFGRRPVLLSAQAGAGLDYLLLALAPNLGWLFVGRIISGVTGASFSTGTAYIADITPPEKRAASFGLIGAAFGLGFIVGPGIGGLLSRISLHAPFFAASALYGVNFLYGLFFLPESLKVENRRPMSLARANSIGSLRNLGRDPVVLGLAVTLTFSYLAQQILQVVWALYTEARYGWTPLDIGISFVGIGVASVVIQGYLLRRIMPALGEQKTLILGNIASMLGFVAFGFATEGWMVYALMLPFSLRGMSGPAMQALMTQKIAANEQGELQGSLASLMSITAIVGPIIGTRLFARFSDASSTPHVPGAPYFMAAVFDLVGLVLALRLFARLKREAAAPP